MLYLCMFCIALLMDLFVLRVACLTVFVNCLGKQFAMCLGVVVILLLNVWKYAMDQVHIKMVLYMLIDYTYFLFIILMYFLPL